MTEQPFEGVNNLQSATPLSASGNKMTFNAKVILGDDNVNSNTNSSGSG